MAGAERERWHFTLVLFLTQQDVVCPRRLPPGAHGARGALLLDLMLTPASSAERRPSHGPGGRTAAYARRVRDARACT